RIRPAGDELLAVPRDQDLVVGDERRKGPLPSGRSQAGKGEHRFAAAGRTGEEKALSTDHDRGGMKIDRLRAHGVSPAGSESVKRAPIRVPVFGSCRFSALSEPPCASAICRLIDRPRPEFWPKLSPSGRSV